ncbi:MAG: DinB family protein [Anaerolineae bacterium]|nr:DinB family protein [Anaerolineae bacterium]
MEDKDSIIRRLDETRAKMRAVVEKIDKAQEVYPGWTIKHVLAHIAGWDDAAINSLRAYLDGEPVEMLARRGVDYYNEQTVTTREALGFEHIFAEWERTREQMKALIDEMSPEELAGRLVAPWGGEGPAARLVLGLAYHEEEHAEEISNIFGGHEA